ncbi:predicted protein [Sclerotinia sclerotiorum 1980 UF-70]|uniref:Uncharacterized protein n=1 Tax=Sclerotinia sclerotiorum (strain ATCC 18683 / 1980 / Ss-1) TaxID=665079 RepID=A7F5S7_SCLS1|nr:predicted protein [Sclerotinia sclerotiorum 1980 UF-70]EDN98098.1 predicted protein [Sclerotinia sclerotiorum 1980 UF-70]
MEISGSNNATFSSKKGKDRQLNVVLTIPSDSHGRNRGRASTLARFPIPWYETKYDHMTLGAAAVVCI